MRFQYNNEQKYLIILYLLHIELVLFSNKYGIVYDM
jgi:hypothetical protein